MSGKYLIVSEVLSGVSKFVISIPAHHPQEERISLIDSSSIRKLIKKLRKLCNSH